MLQDSPDFKLKMAKSPQVNATKRDMDIDENTTLAGSSARQNAFGSHQKLNAARKKHSVEPNHHNMSATIPLDHADSLPNVRGALHSKKTIY